MKKQIYIFDFDGTLADSAPILRKVYNDLATKNGWQELTEAAYQTLRKGTIRDAKKWSGVRFWHFPLVVRSGMKMMRLESSKVKLFPGIKELICDLHNEGHELYVLSRNSKKTILHVLERYKLDDELYILSRRRRTLGSKTAVLKRLVRKKHFDKKNVWMIGDEVRDVMAGNKAGIQTVAVSWGMQDETILKIHKPTKMVHTVDELRSYLQS